MNDLLEAYKNTKYTVFQNDLVIEINKLNNKLNELLNKYNSTEWAFITAFNPYSNVLNIDENIKRHYELQRLTDRYITFEGHGVGEDPSWEPELSLLIIGITKEDAMSIGNKFEQNAIIIGKINSIPELLILKNLAPSKF
jgi:hypothetical protein